MASAGIVSLRKRRTTPPTTHLPWTSISTRSSSGGRTPRPSTRRNEVIFASFRLPFSADKAYPKTTSTCLLPSAADTMIFCFHLRSTVVVLHFSFKANPMSTVTTFVDEKTGEEKERLINKGRWKGFGPTSVSFAEKGVGESFCFVPWGRTPSPNL
jgi:hypothetical protein